jgi:long-chain acyl-CoA synthetase
MDVVNVNSLIDLLRYNATNYGEKISAFCYKRKGVWWKYSWKDYFEYVNALASYFYNLGIKSGDWVLICGPNSPEICIAEMAVYAIGGISLTIRDFWDFQQLHQLITKYEVKVLVLRGREEISKFLSFGDILEKAKAIVFWDYKGILDFPFHNLKGFKEIINENLEKPIEIDRSVSPENICTCVYSEGITEFTTNLYTQEYILQNAKKLIEKEQFTKNEVIMPFFPPVRFMDKIFMFGVHLLSGCTLAFAEREETYMENLREIKPTVLYFSGRTWENLYKNVKTKIPTTGILRKIWEYLLKVEQNKSGIKKSLLNLLFCKPLKAKLGLDKVKLCYNIGPLICDEVIKFFKGIDIVLKNLYWNKKVGLISVTQGIMENPGDMGFPFVGVEVFQTPEGFEVKAHERVKLDDMGMIKKDGKIELWGRKEEVFLEEKEIVSFQLLESQLRVTEGIKDAFVFKENGTLSALIVCDPDRLTELARSKGIEHLSLSDLLEKEEVLGYIKEGLSKVNQKLSEGLKIKRFKILLKPFEIFEGHITLTGHFRRQKIMNEIVKTKDYFKEVEM